MKVKNHLKQFQSPLVWVTHFWSRIELLEYLEYGSHVELIFLESVTASLINDSVNIPTDKLVFWKIFFNHDSVRQIVRTRETQLYAV